MFSAIRVRPRRSQKPQTQCGSPTWATGTPQIKLLHMAYKEVPWQKAESEAEFGLIYTDANLGYKLSQMRN